MGDHVDGTTLKNQQLGKSGEALWRKLLFELTLKCELLSEKVGNGSCSHIRVGE